MGTETVVKKPKDKIIYSRLFWGFIEHMGEIMQKGAEKYPENNWLLLEDEEIINSLCRHVIEIMKGNYKDSESGCTHFGHVAINSMFLYFKLLKAGRLETNANYLNLIINNNEQGK